MRRLPDTVLIAGAGLAGSRCAETLRSRGFDGRILLVGDEQHPPYERPSLSKELLAGARDDVSLRPDSFWEQNGIELLLGRRVKAVDAERRIATIGGENVAWDAFVDATGVQARRLTGPRGVHHLRSLDDALALRAELDDDSRIVVVGAGFVGGEVASTLCGNVETVTVVEPAAAPLERIVGPDVGSLLASRYRRHGIDLRLGVGVEGFEGRDRLTRIRLSDGSAVEADVVVVGIGTTGRTVCVDACGRSSVPGVYACGDVAAWWRPSRGAHVRTEHWTSANGQARAVAAAIVGEPEPFDDTPFFWSDQFGLRLQHLGHADAWSAVVLEGSDDSFTARYVGANGELLAALAANSAAALPGLRQELAA